MAHIGGEMSVLIIAYEMHVIIMREM